MNVESNFDVVVVGAGLCGSIAAFSLGQSGYSVGLVDPRDHCPHSFKAEKLEPDQVELLRELGALDTVMAICTPIHSVSIGRKGKVDDILPINQFGVAYENMVNAIRQALPDQVEQISERALEIDASPSFPTVMMASGRKLRARLIIVATGTADKLIENLGVKRRTVRHIHSLCCGFDMEPVSGQTFAFEALTYHAEDRTKNADYITIFPIGDRIRANIFTYARFNEPWVSQFSKNAMEITCGFFPNLNRITGSWKVCRKAQIRPIHLYTSENISLDGVVLAGDAFQSVCPATGTGVTKVLNDAFLITKVYVPIWLRRERVAESDIRLFYFDKRKQETDRISLKIADMRRDVIVGKSIRAGIRRLRQFIWRLVSVRQLKP